LYHEGVTSIVDMGSALTEARKSLGLSQRALGELVGVKQQQIARWEASAYRTATLARAAGVAEVLGVRFELPGEPLLTAESRATYAAAPSAVPSPVRDLGEIVFRLRARRAELLERYSITAISVFGSFATGEQAADSDVDLLVEFRQPMGFRFVEAARRVEEVLGRRVDVVRPELLKERLRERVLAEAVDVWRA
jgi:uncharacterized protein